MGTKIIKMDTAQGFSAQGAGAAMILASTHFGFPLSTTQVIAGGVMGAGAGKRLSAVRWGVAGNLVIAWVLTLPAAAAIGAACLRLHQHLRRPARSARCSLSVLAIGLGLGALRAADPPRSTGAGDMIGLLLATHRRRQGAARDGAGRRSSRASGSRLRPRRRSTASRRSPRRDATGGSSRPPPRRPRSRSSRRSPSSARSPSG